MVRWFQFVIVLALFATTRSRSQTQVQRPDPLAQLQLTQPSIEISSNVTAQVVLDPPVVAPGEKSTYRVTFNALDESIHWPDELAVPPEVEARPGARGQIFLPANAKLIPETTIIYHLRSEKTGSYTIPSFVVKVYGQSVTVPAVQLEVAAQAPPRASPPLQLSLEFTETNLYAGQSIAARIRMVYSISNSIHGLIQPKLNGDGFLTDQGATRQMISSAAVREGVPSVIFVWESRLTPLITGKIEVSAQGFASGSRRLPGQPDYVGPSQVYTLVDSDPVTLNVQPLPRSGKLPGFTGAIGTFTADPPRLSTNHLRAGDVLKMSVTFNGVERSTMRLVPPPPPAVPGWQIFDAEPGGFPVTNRAVAPNAGFSSSFTYTLIPLTNGSTATPVIPFSYFDPKRAAYVDLSIPAVPIIVVPGERPPDWPVGDTNIFATVEKELTLSPPAKSPGRAVASLVPLQQRGWFMLVQLFPLSVFAGLVIWDQRRRYLAQHPDLVRRRRARRALQRQKRVLRRAIQAGDNTQYASAAISALRVACAPHYPAEPRALVCSDVLALFEERERTGRMGEVIRQFFSASDDSAFSPYQSKMSGLLPLSSEFDVVLKKLEAKL